MYRIDKCLKPNSCRKYDTAETFDKAKGIANLHLMEFFTNSAKVAGAIGLLVAILGTEEPQSVQYDNPEPDGLVYDAWLPNAPGFEEQSEPRMRVYQTS